MKVLVIGAGRMGQRHAQGVLAVNGIDKLIIIDINQQALDTAKTNLGADNKTIEYKLNRDYFAAPEKPDVVIMASTASSRISDCEKLCALEPGVILLEKPLGQSLQEVNDLISLFKKHPAIKVFVNLNTRLYPSFIKLKNDIASLPQCKGVAEVTINMGTVGIGANGIHYIDLMRFLFDADTIEIVESRIDEQVIPSGRGPQFCDFGGWCVYHYKKGNELKARVIFLLSARSTVFGAMNFNFPHARIIVDESEQKRKNKYRKADSQMPIQRYAADYLPEEEEIFTSPELKLLTEDWLKKMMEKKATLPALEESLESHKAMFSWLSKSTTHKGIYPIT